MTLEVLQKDMIMAMKLGDKERKNVLSMVIAQIKKAAIDKGCRDNIDEAFVDAELLKYKKSIKKLLILCRLPILVGTMLVPNL